MTRIAFACVTGLLLLTVAVFQPSAVQTAAQSRRPAGTEHKGKAFRFNKVKDGVYHVVGTGALAVVGNSSIIVNDNDVIVVDDHVSPAAAWVLLDEIKSITDKPVRTVINTHFHFDHAHGNQVFGKNVDIIGHEFTRDMLLKGNPLQMPLYKNYVEGLPGQIDDLRKRVAAEADATRKATLQVQLEAAENNRASQAELTPTPPNVTLRTQMTLLSRRPRNPDPFSGPRPHGRRRRRLSAERKSRDDGRLPDRRALQHERRVRQRVARDAGRIEEARLRHRAAGPRRGVHRQGQDRLLPGLPS